MAISYMERNGTCNDSLKISRKVTSGEIYTNMQGYTKMGVKELNRM
jgi:hypothetical protein